MKRTYIKIGVVAALLFALTACAGPNVMVDVPSVTDTTAGFFWGLLHGFILLFSFIGSLFSENISIYEVHNSGGWYDFGFMIGIALWHVRW